MPKIKIAALQTMVSKDKRENLDRLERLLEDPGLAGVDLVTLGEMFNCPYQTPNFPIYAEEAGGESWQRCSALAKKHGIYLSAGSMPERDREGHIYNTAYVFDRQGRQIARHRKMHLFDIAVSGGQCFRESDTLTAGNDVAVFDTEFGKMGLCVCYDFRFPELPRLMAQRGARVILVPAAFNMTTGPAHWEIMFRQRAVEDQVFAVGTAPARDASSGYTSWGHSIAVDPWGSIMEELGEGPGMLMAAVDFAKADAVRSQIPGLQQLRTDIYEVCEKTVG